jgi:hypothetical protein
MKMPTMEELELAMRNSGIKAGDRITFRFQDIGEPHKVTGVFSETVNETGITGIMLGENRFCSVSGINISSLKKI